MSDASLDTRPVSARIVRGRIEFHLRPLFLETLGVFGVIAMVLAMAAAAVARLVGSDWRFVTVATCVYAGVSAIALAGLFAHPHRRLGVANMITSVRAGLTALIAAALLEVEHLGPGGDAALAWALIAVVIVALALDGCDGVTARYQGTISRFGTRFDMEVDALMVLILSLLAFASGKAGAFVICIGLMRYAYLAIHALFPRLPKELRPSLVRKAICVLQILALGAIMTPVIVPPYSNAIALVALFLLTVSFARDLTAQTRARALRETG